MQDKPDALHTIGLDFTAQSIRGVQISLRKGKPVVNRLFEFPVVIGSEEPNEPLRYTLVKEDEAFRKALESNLVVTTLPPGSTLVRQLEVKLKKIADVDSVLPFQAEPVLPYPVENASLDRLLLGETAEGHLLTLVSVRKDHLQQHLEMWNALDVEPDVVTAIPAALAAFVHQYHPSIQPQTAIHFGETETSFVLVREGKLLAAQVAFLGTNHLLNAIKQDDPEEGEKRFSQLNFAEMNKEAFPALVEAMDQLRMEITRTLYALSKQARGEEIAQIIATGDGAILNHFVPTLLNPLGKPFVVPAPEEGAGLTAAEMNKFAIPFGAALTGLPKAEQINFRQGDFSHPQPWKRYKTPLLLFAALSVGLAFALLFAGNSYLNYQEDSLKIEYSELLQSLNKPYTDFEKGFTKNEQTLPIQKLTQADIRNRLQKLQKEIQSAPEYYPLLPNVPTVSDLLAWLATHPNVVERDPATQKLKSLLELESLNYMMIKRPEQTKKQERYQVKVELEFSSETPKAAREFHDALIAPNAMVDPKAEVKWSTNRGLYRASFFLKDKTVYPTASS